MNNLPVGAWPGTFSALCAHIEQEAIEKGVCPKIFGRTRQREVHACGRPLVEGTRYCRFHQHGV